MHTLKSKTITAVFDEQARLVSFTNTACTKESIIVGPPKSAFRMTCQQGDCKEVVAELGTQLCKAAATKTSVKFTFDGVKTFDGRHHETLPIKLTLSATLKDEKIVFNADIDNQSDARILDFTYPIVGPIVTLGNSAPALLLPNQTGQRIQNVGTWLGRMPRHRENAFNAHSVVYPGGGASMQWQALTDDVNTLFLTGHDPDFFPTELRQQGEVGKNTVVLEDTRMICLAAGKSMAIAETVLDFYHGDWHKGAKDYAAWMSQYRPQPARPEWIQNMTGYFLVINKQQFGYEMWPYDSLPKLYELAQAHGCDTVGLFGWYHSGHDNQYPDLEVSPTLGGEETLRENIKAVQKAGGHVTLYYQGHLIDETSQYYRNGEGKAVCMKNIWGSPYVEFYNKSHRSSFLMHFSRKMFALACPSAAPWRDLMLRREDWLAALGPDGCLYDQLGGQPPCPCFDEHHDHAKNNPALAHTNGRRRMLNSLQAHSKQIGKNFAFLSEHINDLYSCYLDAVHGIMSHPGPQGALAAASTDADTVRILNYPALFRYSFPETIITIRNPAPHIGDRMANFALTYGFRPEMELRYQADCDDVLNDTYKTSRLYALKINELRKKYADQLLRGEFRDTDELVAVLKGLTATSFVNGDTMAAVLWNDTSDAIELKSFAANAQWKLKEASSIAKTTAKLPATIAAGQILVVLFAK